MKKVGIVSCYFQPNYGSMLQAYATQKILDILEIPNETICIDGFSDEIKKSKMQYFKSRIFSFDVIKDKLGYVKLTIHKKLNKDFARNVGIRNNKFKEFSCKTFNISKKFNSKFELGENSDSYSAFLVGSDQLWLPSNIAADYYTLNFVKDGIRKIAYATSFGVSSLPDEQEKKAKDFIPKIDYLSVREKSGQKLIKNITGLDAQVVCDPTLLLTADQWMEIQKKERFIDEDYIFCYFLGNNKFSRECADKLRKKTGLKIVALQHLDAYIKDDNTFADIAPYDVDPADFVNLIRNASYVCTDSFHGTVFSIINHKQFFSFRRFVENTTMSTNSRLDSILEAVNQKNRIITTDKEFNTAISTEIDFSEVDEKLNVFRESSMQFLENALNGLENL
ncbi:MAG: polysaccharide pyruvyl transferase family protein [Oscillospiraceae bacterium]|nr:polysaccharide pyruvyl transferase family protein [Oscillospiraceae bacterium]